MPFVTVNGVRLHYRESGHGQETIVFSHGLLMSGDMFARQVHALSNRYRCIAYDHRGQGHSEVTESGYDMDTLAGDAAALIEALGAAQCHFVGLSMGGFVGMRLAIHRPELLRSLVLMETSADPEPHKIKYRAMAWFGRLFGFRPLLGPVTKIMFGRSFLADPDMREQRDFWRQHFLNLDRAGTFRAAQGVIDREGVFERLSQIQAPTLVLVGDEDIATTPAKAERIRQNIPRAKLTVIAGAGHSSSIEQPDRVTTEIRDFLEHL
ncbi:MAG: alpha/beta fold hydrolase [Xanthomonadales bacterium]|nr:alpha/beta fold hydrolase [Xanthomonadales bacterium]